MVILTNVPGQVDRVIGVQKVDKKGDGDEFIAIQVGPLTELNEEQQ